MTIDTKLILENSKNLNILYVEDDEMLRNSTGKIFSHYFNQVDLAVDGKDGLKKYLAFNSDNGAYYDLVITDINMPHMSGIEMSEAIVHENTDQAIIFITAHNETSYLHSAIKVGVNGFLTKPIDSDQLKVLLYKTTQAISDRKLVTEYYRKIEELNMQLQQKNDALNEERKKVEKQIRLLEIQANATDTKHQQVEQLLQQQSPETSEPLLDEYFAQDEDEGSENVLFMKDDCDEMSEMFNELPELMMQYTVDHNIDHINTLGDYLAKVSSILLHYTPFLDPLAKSFEELTFTIRDNIDDFVRMFEANPDSAMVLFDAIGIDMERYMERFSVESMAMKNIHHIHHPTSLSVQQIIGMICPDEVEDGEIEFF